MGRVVTGFTEHARDRMRTLGLVVDDIIFIVEAGEVIETDPLHHGRLYLGRVGSLVLHVAAVHDPNRAVTLVTTVYEPDAGRWIDNRVRRD